MSFRDKSLPTNAYRRKNPITDAWAWQVPTLKLW
jgi:hypothetical protein